MLKIGIIPLSTAVTALFFFALSLHAPFSALWLLPAFLLIVPAFFLPVCDRLKKGRAKQLLQRCAEACIVGYLYLMIALLCDAALMIVFYLFDLSLSLPLLFSLSAVLLAVALAGGILHARTLKNKTLRLSFGDGKNKKTVRAFVFSDLHLGFFTTRAMLGRIASAAAQAKPDVILCAGDLFDGVFDDLKLKEEAISFFSALNAPLGFYFCEGNHDAYSEGDARKEEFLKACRLTALRDERTVLQTFDLIGRKDRKKKDRLHESAICLKNGRPLIVLDHQPANAEKVIDAGADLVICGHTHNGQTFPGNILAKITGKYNYGLKKYKNGYVLTTAGAGYWGLPMRLFTANETVTLDLVFCDSKEAE